MSSRAFFWAMGSFKGTGVLFWAAFLVLLLVLLLVEAFFFVDGSFFAPGVGFFLPRVLMVLVWFLGGMILDL